MCPARITLLVIHWMTAMINIEDCIDLKEISAALAFTQPTAPGEAAPLIDYVEIPGISEVEFASLHAYVLEAISDHGGTHFLSMFNSFEGFYDWLDTAEHYEQEDTETSLAEQLPWLAFIFIMLNRGYQYLDAQQQRHGPMTCASCKGQILKGQYRVSELPDAYVVEHRACCDHDPSWMLVDNEERDKKTHAADYVEACKAFRLKWKTTALDDEIAHYSV